MLLDAQKAGTLQLKTWHLSKSKHEKWILEMEWELKHMPLPYFTSFFYLNPAVKVYQSSRAIFSVFNLFASATFNRTIQTTQN